jgi:Immunity protein 61
VSTTSLQATITDWADVAGYGTLIDADGRLCIAEESMNELIYTVSESADKYSISRSERGGQSDVLAWDLSETTAATYLVAELGTAIRSGSRLPRISRYLAEESLHSGFTLARGDRGGDSLFKGDALVGTFYNYGLGVPAVFYSLVSALSLGELEAAYLTPDGGALQDLLKTAGPSRP